MQRSSRALIAALSALIVSAVPGGAALAGQNLESDGKHHWLFPNHPRLRRITKAAGFGVATGGILGPVLGVGAVTGATAGAAEHGGVRAWKDQRDLKKHKHLDTHVW